MTATANRDSAHARPPGTMPDLRYSEAEEELRGVVRGLFAERNPWPALIARIETSEPGDPALWRTLGTELGCAGLLIPEAHGGAGASYREAAVVAEETGYAVAPVPYLGSAVMATAALLGTGDELLEGLASGQVTAALVVPFAQLPPRSVHAAARPGGIRAVLPRLGDPPGVTRLSGQVAGVADALAADVLLVPADGAPFGLYAVDANSGEVSRAPVISLDATRPLADLTLDGAPGRVVAVNEDAAAGVLAGLWAGTAMLASEQLGTAQRCLEETVAYVKERRQFARPVGSFQALKHRLADVWIAVTQARAAARYAAACLAEGDPDVSVAVTLAKAACGEAAVHAAQECVQLHGGIGFTWEHPAHVLLKRAKSGSIAFGTPDRHRAALARMVGLPPAGQGG
jgi:alkylation response protein AidB-like acyl-CoA dehydrogenase